MKHELVCSTCPQDIAMLLLSVDGRALEDENTHWTRSCQTSCNHRKWPVTASFGQSCKAEEETSVDILACLYTKPSQVQQLLIKAANAALSCILRRYLTGNWPL